MIITKTPYRISFFGGGSDYPQWYKKHGGSVLSTTIDKHIYITCRHLPDFFKHKYRIVWSKIASRVDDKIGENVSSGNLPVYPDTPLAPLMAADRAVAIVTLPNGANPAG